MAKTTTKKHEKREHANPIDRKWFRERMDALGLDRDRVASAFGVAPYMVSRMVTGERPIRLAEVGTWAKCLEVHPVEVLRRLGVDIPPATVPVIGVLRGNARVSILPPDKVANVESPRLPPGPLVALQIETSQTALAIYHGGLLYYEPSEVVLPGAFGRLSVVELGDVPAPVVGVIDRGRSIKGGRVTVFGGLETIESDQLQSAAPILWQRAG